MPGQNELVPAPEHLDCSIVPAQQGVSHKRSIHPELLHMLGLCKL